MSWIGWTQAEWPLNEKGPWRSIEKFRLYGDRNETALSYQGDCPRRASVAATSDSPQEISRIQIKSMSDVEERVIRVIAETQQIDPNDITRCSTFAELDIDSFDGINVLFAIESEFDISVPDDDAKTTARYLRCN